MGYFFALMPAERQLLLPNLHRPNSPQPFSRNYFVTWHSIYCIRPSSPRPYMRPDRIGRYEHDSYFLRWGVVRMPSKATRTHCSTSHIKAVIRSSRDSHALLPDREIQSLAPWLSVPFRCPFASAQSDEKELLSLIHSLVLPLQSI